MLRDHVHKSDGRPEELIKDDLEQRPHIHLVHDGFQLNTEACQRLLERIRLLAEHLAVQLVERLEDEVHESPIRLGVRLLARELALVEPDVAPEPIGERVDVQRA